MESVKVYFIIIILSISIWANVSFEIQRDNSKLQESSVIHRYMIDLLKSCFIDQLQTLVITPDMYDDIQVLWDSEPFPVILTNGKFAFDSVYLHSSRSATYVLRVYSVESLEFILSTIKSSALWSIDALFFIVGTPETGCQQAKSILKLCWKMNLLSTLFFCRENIYTYNPYTNHAPYPWIKVENSNNSDGRWTLYKQKYSEGRESCESLNFDKTKVMNGFKVKAVANAKPGMKWNTNTDYNFDSLIEKNPSTEDAYFTEVLFSAMNMTVKLHFDHTGDYENGIPKGYLTKLLVGSHDISLSVRNPMHNISSTYPIFQKALKILTHRERSISPEKRVLAFYSAEIYYCIIVMIFITLIIRIMVHKRVRIVSSIIDILRLILSIPLIMPFNRLSIRIYFICVFLIVIILNTVFQGKFSAFLTKFERFYIDHPRDLRTYDYNIYIPSSQKYIFDSTGIERQRIHYFTGLECSEYVMNNTNVACIEMTHRSLRAAKKFGLHISRSNAGIDYVAFWCRKDWPLVKKFNRYLLYLTSAGIHEYWRIQKLGIPMRKYRSEEAEKAAFHLRPIKFNDLIFAWKLFIFGLFIAISSFLIEILFNSRFLRDLGKIKRIC